MIKELAHFLRVTPTARRLQASMSGLDCYELVERDLDLVGKRQYRASLVADLAGDVLEIGVGTGLMLPHYPRGVRLVGIDPDVPALRRAATRAAESDAQILLLDARAESLPFPSETFDAVVSASVLCSVGSLADSLAEVKRVLRQGGQLRLLEHVRSDRLVPGVLMDAFNPVWLALNRIGCNWNRDLESALQHAG